MDVMTRPGRDERVAARLGIARRIAAVRAAKDAKMLRAEGDGGEVGLTDEELDAALGPLDARPAYAYPKRGMGRNAAPASPCCVCGTDEGYRPKTCRRPTRVDVTQFGVPGLACRRCYEQLRRPARPTKARPEVAVKKLLPAPPCALCPPSPPPPPGAPRPERWSGRALGVDGVLCTTCYGREYYRRKLSARRDAS